MAYSFALFGGSRKAGGPTDAYIHSSNFHLVYGRLLHIGFALEFWTIIKKATGGI